MAANQTVTIYGITQNRFIEDSPKTTKKAIYGLGFPLGKNTKTGGFFVKTSGIELIKNAVKQLLNTERGERVMLPKYGCNLRRFLFQPLDEVTFEEIKEEILYSFNNYITGARIKRLAVIPLEDVGPAGGNSLLVRLILSLVEDDLKVFDVEVRIK